MAEQQAEEAATRRQLLINAVTGKVGTGTQVTGDPTYRDLARCDRNHFVPTGTFCFNSSNQFSTTLICVGAVPPCSVGLSIRKC